MEPYLLTTFFLLPLLIYTARAHLPPFPSLLPRPPLDNRNQPKEPLWDNTIVKDPSHNLHTLCEKIHLLRQVTIPDLIPLILDLAEHWVVTSAARTARRAKFTARTAGQTYVMAALPAHLPVGSVRKMRFCIVSRDQGWSDFPADHGTYQNSHTWFEVAVFEADGVTPVEGVLPLRIITNLHAGKCWTEHDVTWTRDAPDRKIRDLLAGLRGGQRVALTAWARYPGWANHVSGADIEIYIPTVRRG